MQRAFQISIHLSWLRFICFCLKWYSLPEGEVAVWNVLNLIWNSFVRDHFFLTQLTPWCLYQFSSCLLRVDCWDQVEERSNKNFTFASFGTPLSLPPCNILYPTIKFLPNYWTRPTIKVQACHSFELHTQYWGQPGFHFKHFSRSALILSPIWPQHRPESELIFELWQALACRFFCTRVRSLPDLVCKSLTNWCYWDSNKELMHITLFGTRSIIMVAGFHSIV